MSGQTVPGAAQLRVGASAISKQPFTTMWPSYYADGSGGSRLTDNVGGQRVGLANVDSSQVDDAEALRLEREQRVLKRKQANRESAKRSKLKRKQAESELQEHARQVDEERDNLTSQLVVAQQRYADAHKKHMDLRRIIQSYIDGPAETGVASTGACG